MENDEIDKLVGEDYKELEKTIGSGAEQSRIRFNSKDERFNKIERGLTEGKLDLIEKIEELKKTK